MFRRITAFPMKSVFGQKIPPMPKFNVGDLCEVILERALREEECASSKVIGNLAPAVAFEVLAVGFGDITQFKVRTFKRETGWICSKEKKKLMSKSSLAIKKSTRALVAPGELDDIIRVGQDYEIMLKTYARTVEDVNGPLCLDLHPGTPVKVVERGKQ